MKKLIEKIEALKNPPNNTNTDTGYLTRLDNSIRNQAIDDGIKSIKSEYEEKDQPDSEGWWWNGKEFVDVIFIDTPEGGFYAHWNYEACQNIACEKGKWVKAIVPAKSS